MNLDKNEVHIWSFSLKMTADELTSAMTLLDHKEKQRAASFLDPIHREHFIVAHARLRLILSDYCKSKPADISFAFNKQKKPRIENKCENNIQFNLSHSNELGVCAITLDSAIGVDIEHIKERPTQDIANRFFSAEEKMRVNADDGLNVFYAIWARKEAILKATGKGLTTPLKSFTIPDTNYPSTLTLDDENWCLTPVLIHDDYAAAVACAQPIHKIQYLELHGSAPHIIKEERY